MDTLTNRRPQNRPRKYPDRKYAKRGKKGVCVIEGCDEPTVGRGHCRSHYYKLKYYGDANHAGSGRRIARGATAEDRFWARVNKDGPVQPHMATACWEWTAGRFTDYKGDLSYGCVTFQKKNRLVHKVAWYLVKGEWPPDGLHLLHACHNVICVNPAHLRTGTNAENMQDRSDAGRQVQGSAVGTAKLTEADVVKILAAIKRGEQLIKIAKAYNVRRQSISRIKKGTYWKHVPRL